MKLQYIKRLTFLLPILFIGSVLFIFTVGENEQNRLGLFIVFLVLAIGTIVFTSWIFRLVEHREEEIARRSNQLSALYDAALSMTEELQLGKVLQKVVDQARVLAGAKYGALSVLNEDGDSIRFFGTVPTGAEIPARIGKSLALQRSIAGDYGNYVEYQIAP
jgi:hypothetical protein